MNDNVLSDMVRESVADIHSATPVAQIISRGRALRARRRISGVAGVLAVGAGTALAVTALAAQGHSGMLGSGHPVGRAATTRLAAWTVAQRANGDIDVTINQLKNPAGLQSTLRADGLPVSVTFSGHSPSASCQLYPTSSDVLSAVVQYDGTAGSSVPLVINPSALPAGVGLAIFVGASDRIAMSSSLPPGTDAAFGIGGLKISDGRVREVLELAISPVHTRRQCTG